MFRLLMNGQVLTSKMQGCPADADLCDVQVLLDRVTPFATADRDCKSQKLQHPAIQESEVLLSTTGGIMLVMAIVLASGLLGSVLTYSCMARRLPCRRKYAYQMGDGISGYHDEVDGFQDEPDEDIDGGNVQLKTVAALVE